MNRESMANSNSLNALLAIIAGIAVIVLGIVSLLLNRYVSLPVYYIVVGLTIITIIFSMTFYFYESRTDLKLEPDLRLRPNSAALHDSYDSPLAALSIPLLKKDVEGLGREVAKAQASIEDEAGVEIASDVSADVLEVLHEASNDPRVALMLLSAKIEDQVQKRLREADMGAEIRYLTAGAAIRKGVSAGIFPPEVLPAYNDFWELRNRIAHGLAFDVDTSTILALISLGTELLKLISAEKKEAAR